jgi:general secretion pathway protein G
VNCDHIIEHNEKRNIMRTLKNRLAEARTDDGFTLVELLIVIVILAVLSGIVVFAVSGISDKSVTAACKTDLKQVESATEAFYANAAPHAYPANVAALVSGGLLREAPSSTDYAITTTGGVVSATHGGAAGCP